MVIITDESEKGFDRKNRGDKLVRIARETLQNCQIWDLSEILKSQRTAHVGFFLKPERCDSDNYPLYT